MLQALPFVAPNLCQHLIFRWSDLILFLFLMSNHLTKWFLWYRYEKGHASGHWSDKHHHFSLELEKQQIWDYVGDKYVHRLNQSKVDGKSVITNSRCTSVEECETCGYHEEEGLDGVLFSSKIEGVLLIHFKKTLLINLS